MKLNELGKGIHYPIAIIGILFALTSSEANASCCVMGPTKFSPPGEVYVGIFGGGGTSTKINVSQFGTAYYTEANGGPLAVDAFGKTDRRTVGLVGGHVGYQWLEIFSNPPNSQWGLAPAVEWEGYYLSKSSFTSHDINNDTVRLPEHDFLVTYPMKAGVFLTNAVLSINPSCLSRFHPYVGAGIGAAVVSISNANAAQVSPAEPGINHYNSDASDTDTTFAAQTKVGLNVDLCRNISIFVEYRWLYLSDSHYEFGSTVYPGHPATSNWLVKMDSQCYNMGAIGIQYRI